MRKASEQQGIRVYKKYIKSGLTEIKSNSGYMRTWNERKESIAGRNDESTNIWISNIKRKPLSNDLFPKALSRSWNHPHPSPPPLLLPTNSYSASTIVWHRLNHGADGRYICWLVEEGGYAHGEKRLRRWAHLGGVVGTVCVTYAPLMYLCASSRT